MTARNTPKRDVTMPLCGKENPIDGMLCPFADEVWSVMSFFTPRVPKWDDPVFEISRPRSFASWKALPCALANGTEVPGGHAQEHWRCRQSATALQPPPQSSADPTFEPCINSSCSTMFLPYYRISFHDFLPLLLFSRRSLLPPVTHCRSFFPRSFVYRSSRPSTRS
jgi:hypothetical protein